jgi:Peptidase family M48
MFLYSPDEHVRELVNPSFRSTNSPTIGTALNLKRCSQIFLLTISLVRTTLPISARVPSIATSPTSTLEEVSDDQFVFGKVDQDLLGEIKLLDDRFEKEAAVYHEFALDAYLNRVGTAVVADKKIENVEWKFRALRDPVPNAFALPNGSIYINTGLVEDDCQVVEKTSGAVARLSRTAPVFHYRYGRRLRALLDSRATAPGGGNAVTSIDRPDSDVVLSIICKTLTFAPLLVFPTRSKPGILWV